MKIHTGDTVVIISGKDKGKSGTVLRVLHERNHVVVTGINMRTRHVKKTFQQAGRILKYEASMNASKVMLLDPKTKKPTRIGMAMKDGKKVRIAKKSGEVVRKVAATGKAPVKGVASSSAAAPESGGTKKSAPAASKPAGSQGKSSDSTQGKQPFWKRLQFGADVESVGAPEETRSKQDHTIPAQNIPNKTSGRGS